MTVLEQRYMETVCHSLPRIAEALESIAEVLKGSEVTVINSNKPKEDSNV